MNPDDIHAYILRIFADIHPVSAWGETSFFYNPGRRLARGVYFATLKDRDGKHDRASQLDRTGAFRLSMGIRKTTWQTLFGPLPARPAAGGVVATGHDFTLPDQLMPHPVYGWMAWVCVLNPDARTFEAARPLLDEAYGQAVLRFSKRELQTGRSAV